jgi:nitrile hydratase
VSYRPGQRVRVDAREHEGHHRTPAYLKGKTGTVERTHAAFRNPETRAYGGDGLPDYRGHADDRLYVDVFEHWLREAQ